MLTSRAKRTALHHSSSARDESIPHLTAPILASSGSRSGTTPQNSTSSTSTNTSTRTSTPTPTPPSATTPTKSNSQSTNTGAGLMNRIPLLLDPEQAQMIDQLNSHLPQMERVVTWWPWCWNTHAMLIVRWVRFFFYFISCSSTPLSCLYTSCFLPSYAPLPSYYLAPSLSLR
jgi:hypothetical protein